MSLYKNIENILEEEKTQIQNAEERLEKAISSLTLSKTILSSPTENTQPEAEETLPPQGPVDDSGVAVESKVGDVELIGVGEGDVEKIVDVVVEVVEEREEEKKDETTTTEIRTQGEVEVGDNESMMGLREREEEKKDEITNTEIRTQGELEVGKDESMMGLEEERERGLEDIERELNQKTLFENSDEEDEEYDVVKDKKELKEEEDDWLSDLEVDEIIKRKIVDDAYTHSCKVLGIVPVSYFQKRISTIKIVMKHHGLGPKGAQAIAQVLEYNNTIQELDLTANNCASGTLHIGQSLRTNLTLRYLNLSENNLLCKGFGKEFSEMLIENSTLKILILAKNKLNDHEVSTFCSGLKHNNTLMVLDLSENEIGDIGVSELGACLAVNTGVKELNLSWNHIRPRGAAAFFGNIKDNYTIDRIQFDNNGIGDSTQQLSVFIQKSNELVSISLNRTRLTDVGIIQLSKGIETSTSLVELKVANNPFTEACMQAFGKSCSASGTLKSLDISDVRFGKEGRLRIDEMKTANPELKIIE